MNQTGHDRGDRREFFRGGARYALLAALGAVSAVLFRRGGGQLTGANCINQGICSGCTAYAGCGLPAALSRKEFFSRRARDEAAHAPRTKRGVPAASTSPDDSTFKRASARAPEVT